MDAAAAAAAVADYRSNGEEGRRRSGSKMRGDAMRGGTVARIQCGVAMCRAAPRPRNRSGFRVVVSLLPPPEERFFSFTERKREREREGGKATGEGRDGTKGRENVKLPPLFSGALFAGRADWTGLDWLGGSLQKELRTELSRP